jgi:hypothetical protein
MFNISKALDKDGQEIEPPISWFTGITTFVPPKQGGVTTSNNLNRNRHLKPFGCRITPRSAETAAMLMNA